MGKTLTEKIFAKKLGRPEISPGEILVTPVDLIVGTDVTVPLSVNVFESIGATKVRDPEKIVFVNDHFVPAKDIASANFSLKMREFASNQGVGNHFEVGRAGICHVTVPENGLVHPGDLIIGADSHTCTYGALGAFSTGVGSTDMAAAWVTGETWFKVPETIRVDLKGTKGKNVSGKDIILHIIKMLGEEGAVYKAVEFGGPLIPELNMADRFTICNMVIEMGAKAGIMPVDRVTLEYMRSVGGDPEKGTELHPDPDAEYVSRLEVDVSELEPLVAAPHSPANVMKAREAAGIRIDQVVIGSCTNGRIEDFRIAHDIIKNNRIADHLRLILIPGSPSVLLEMEREGMIADFIRAGAVLSPSTCGPCIGGHMGSLGDHEVGLYTTNRNFVGRNGSISSKVYLSNPAVAASSAIAGCIALPPQ